MQRSDGVLLARTSSLAPLLRLEGKVTARPMEFCETESQVRPDNRVPELKWAVSTNIPKIY